MGSAKPGSPHFLLTQWTEPAAEAAQLWVEIPRVVDLPLQTAWIAGPRAESDQQIKNAARQAALWQVVTSSGHPGSIEAAMLHLPDRRNELVPDWTIRVIEGRVWVERPRFNVHTGRQLSGFIGTIPALAAALDPSRTAPAPSDQPFSLVIRCNGWELPAQRLPFTYQGYTKPPGGIPEVENMAALAAVELGGNRLDWVTLCVDNPRRRSPEPRRTYRVVPQQGDAAVLEEQLGCMEDQEPWYPEGATGGGPDVQSATEARFRQLLVQGVQSLREVDAGLRQLPEPTVPRRGMPFP